MIDISLKNDFEWARGDNRNHGYEEITWDCEIASSIRIIFFL